MSEGRSRGDGDDVTKPQNQAETALEDDPWVAALGDSFQDLCQTHKILGFFVHWTAAGPSIKAALIARDTYFKLVPSAAGAAEWLEAEKHALSTEAMETFSHIILKMGRPGHYTIGLLDLNHNSIEYFDSEGAIAYSSSTPGHVRYPQQSYTTVGDITVVTPCTFPFQTDTATARYWEDGYCQTWVWFFIYNRLGLHSAPEELEPAVSATIDTKVAPVEKKIPEAPEAISRTFPAVQKMLKLGQQLKHVTARKTITRISRSYTKRLNEFAVCQEFLNKVIAGPLAESELSWMLDPTMEGLLLPPSGDAEMGTILPINNGDDGVNEWHEQFVEIFEAAAARSTSGATITIATSLGILDDLLTTDFKGKWDAASAARPSVDSLSTDTACGKDLSFLLNLFWTELLVKGSTAAKSTAGLLQRAVDGDVAEVGDLLEDLAAAPLKDFLRKIKDSKAVHAFRKNLNSPDGQHMIKRGEIWAAMGKKDPTAFLLKKWTTEEEARKTAAATAVQTIVRRRRATARARNLKKQTEAAKS